MNTVDLEPHRGVLQAVSYRMLGSVQEAEEVVQDTFVRAITRPPADTRRPWRPWLMRVATNLCRDRLRKRRAAPYRGPWLPAPLPTELADPQLNPEARVLRAASASYAWMVAAERLTPEQRAAWVLREVFELDMAEVADALGRSEEAIRSLLYRARKQVAEPDGGQGDITQYQTAFAGLMTALLSEDGEALRAALAPEVCATSDGGGIYHAALRPIVGVERVARFLQSLTRFVGPDDRWSMVAYNGRPAMWLERVDPKPGVSPHAAVLIGLNAEGLVQQIWTVLVDAKLATPRP